RGERSHPAGARHLGGGLRRGGPVRQRQLLRGAPRRRDRRGVAGCRDRAVAGRRCGLRGRRPMKRPVLAGLAVAALLLSGCAAEVEPPTPPVGVDLSTADPADGNGLWLRSGPAVTAIVAEAMR